MEAATLIILNPSHIYLRDNFRCIDKTRGPNPMEDGIVFFSIFSLLQF